MRKIIAYSLLAVALAGCNSIGLRPSDPESIQPKAYTEALSNQSIESATQQAIKEIGQRAPWLFKDHQNFVVGSAYNRADLSKTYKLGRAIGKSLTTEIGKKKRARQIHYRDNMLRTDANLGAYLGLSQEAGDFAQRIGADTLVVATYEAQGNQLTIHLSFVRAVDSYPLLQYSYQAMMDDDAVRLAKQY